MTPVWITAANAVTALGGNLETSWARLLRAQAAIEKVERFSTENYKSHVAACVKGLQASGEQSLAYGLPEGPPDVTLKMTGLFKAVVNREIADGAYRRYLPGSTRAFSKE